MNKNIKIVAITEVCAAGEGTKTVMYDKLPKPVKEAVDAALAAPDNLKKIDIHTKGLQFLLKHERDKKVNCCLIPGEKRQVEFLGNVYLHDINMVEEEGGIETW